MISAWKSATHWCPWWTRPRAASCCSASGAAPASRPAARLSRALHPYHRQPQAQAARVRDLPARRRDRSLGDVPGPPARYQFGSQPPALDGFDTREPAFGMAAKWIAPGLQELALQRLRGGRPDLRARHPHCRNRRSTPTTAYPAGNQTPARRGESQPKLVDELVPRLLTLGEVQKVLQQLLREQVSIRDLTTIFEVLDTAAANKTQVALVEATRQALGRALVQPLLGGRQPAGGHPRSGNRRAVNARLLRTNRGRQRRAGAVLRPPGAGRAEEAGGRAGPHGDAGGLLQARRRASICAACWNRFCPRWWWCRRGSSAGGGGAVAGNHSLRRKHECRSSLRTDE